MMVKTDEQLAILVGGVAQIWGFHATHDRLAVRVKCVSGEIKYLSFVFCVRLGLSTRWRVSDPHVTRDGDYIDFVDGDICIRCMELSLWDIEQ